MTKPVAEAVLALRDGLKGVYQRTVGAKTILFHLHAQRVALHLDAQQRQLHVQHRGQRVKSLPLRGIADSPMPFQDYLRRMLEEARSIERYLNLKEHQPRR